jgi:hypothetical protein
VVLLPTLLAAPTAAGEPFRVGINEALAVPGRRQDSADIGAELAVDAARAAAVGARLVRGHTGNFPRVSLLDLDRRPGLLEQMDSWVRAAQAAGLEPVAMVSPWPANQTANHTPQYLPEPGRFADYVRRLVERYDHDGIEDMPGLVAPVRYWEVDNEPDLKNSLAPRGDVRRLDPRTFCLPEEYGTVLAGASAAIHAASPEARVLGPGLYRPGADSGTSYLRAALAVEGAASGLDIVTVHSYRDDDGRELAAGIEAVRKLVPGKPLWVTETSVPTHADEAEHARRLVAIAARAAVAGAEALLWHTLADPPPGRRIGGTAENSLFATLPDGTVREKAAAAVFRNLAAKLARDDLTGAVPDGAGAVRLRSGAVLVYEGSRPAPNGGTDLRTGAKVSGTVKAPGWVEP